MKSKKLIKKSLIAGLFTVITSATTVSIVQSKNNSNIPLPNTQLSQGNFMSDKSALKNSDAWNTFKIDSANSLNSHDKVVKVLLNMYDRDITLPPYWATLAGNGTWNNAFRMTKSSFDDKNHVAVFTIKNTLSETGDLDIQIVQKNSEIFNINGFYIKGQPAPTNSKWINFRDAAMKFNANDILSVARKSSDWKNLKWKIGDSSQVVWTANNKAEFDIYGALTNNDASGYRGMNGKIAVDEGTHEVTAIISKVGKEGSYDSDPIVATATYKKGQSYSNGDWSFSATQQLQSIEKVKYLYKTIVDPIKNIIYRPDQAALFFQHNWITMGRVTRGIHHGNANSMYSVLWEFFNYHGLLDTGGWYESDNDFKGYETYKDDVRNFGAIRFAEENYYGDFDLYLKWDYLSLGGYLTNRFGAPAFDHTWRASYVYTRYTPIHD